MLLDEKNITRLYIENYFTAYGIRTEQVLEVSSMDLLIEFAKTGLGIACVIKEFVKEELNNKTLVEVQLPSRIEKREVGFAYKKERLSQDSLQKFMQQMARIVLQ
jgi:DNA-binding transcriptional LysR family regulator